MNEEMQFFLMRLAERMHRYADDDGSDISKVALALYDCAAEHQENWAQFSALRRPGETLAEAELRNPARTMEMSIEQDAVTARMEGRTH